jgi:hypothetical protein
MISERKVAQESDISLDRLIAEQRSKGVAVQEVCYTEGYRVWSERVGSAFIVHQYGLGEDELAFAYGAGLHAASYSYLQTNLYRGEVAVLGSSFTGLLTAIALHKMGQTVTVYDQDFPRHREKAYSLDKPIGQACSGVPLPINTTTRFLSSKDEFVVKDSSHIFLTYVEENKLYRGIAWQKGFAEGNPEFLYVPFSIRNIAPATKMVEGELVQGVSFEYLQINPEIFLFELYSEAKFRGVRFVKARFRSKAEIAALAQVVINTRGEYGLLCGDNSVRFKRHFFRYLEPSAGQPCMYYGRLQGKKMLVACQSDKIVLMTGSEEY